MKEIAVLIHGKRFLPQRGGGKEGKTDGSILAI
jgi:hypothetical protein